MALWIRRPSLIIVDQRTKQACSFKQEQQGQRFRGWLIPPRIAADLKPLTPKLGNGIDGMDWARNGALPTVDMHALHLFRPGSLIEPHYSATRCNPTYKARILEPHATLTRMTCVSKLLRDAHSLKP